MLERRCIDKAKVLLKNICTQFRCHDRSIMQGVKGEKKHALEVLKWVDKLNPNAPIYLRLAALFHDVDRIVTPMMGGGFKGERNSKDYLCHKAMHAKRSARFVLPHLETMGLPDLDLQKIRFLIVHHDDSGERVRRIDDPDLYILVAADTFAFFSSIAPRLLAVEGEKRLKDKTKFMIDKLAANYKQILYKDRFPNQEINDLKNKIIKGMI